MTNKKSTFNLPNLTDKFIHFHGTAGTVKSAGLPNITGTVGGSTYRTDITYGAFADSESGGRISGGGSSWFGATNARFNASKFNSIYGASSTVQPPALTMRAYIKY